MEVTPKAAKLKLSSSCNSAESSPCEFKGGQHHQKLSSSLKERLRRTRRSFTSPLSVAKRLCVDDDEEEEEEDGQQASAHSRKSVTNPALIIPNVDVNRNEAKSGSERFAGPIPTPTRPPSDSDLAQQLDQLRKEVKDKTETLRRLKMVQMYRSKNDLTKLQTLIDKWRRCAQAALCELQPDVPTDGGKASLSELIDLFGLDDAILHFDRKEEDFTT